MMNAPLVVPTQEMMTVGGPQARDGPLPDPPAQLAGPPLSVGLFCLCCPNPLAWAGCCTKVETNSQQAVLYWGRYSGTISEPGMHCLNPCGRDLRGVSTRYTTLELKDIKVVDARGNPIIISGVITYAMTSAKKACVDVDRPHDYLKLQATTVMKQVAGTYPYGAAPGQPSLQTASDAIRAELTHALQEKATITGAHIHNFEFVDLSYAPEIAQVMLAKQQAEALVEARRLIVGAAVDMSQQVVRQLDEQGMNMTNESKERITTNLLAVICSHNAPTPTIPLH
mmetsp:Transcript_54004/g.152167  ORF Transcript_54004/g.152167 Transcript_54004/m.152167 type:complete len:283 (+) Transcript_54004:76-924(+)